MTFLGFLIQAVAKAFLAEVTTSLATPAGDSSSTTHAVYGDGVCVVAEDVLSTLDVIGGCDGLPRRGSGDASLTHLR